MLEKLSLYETKTVSGRRRQHYTDMLLSFLFLTRSVLQKLYVIATDRDAQRYRVLKIDRTPAVRPAASSEGSTPDDAEEFGLSITEDLTTYSYRQKEELLETLRAGNAGLKTVDKPCFGIAGACIPGEARTSRRVAGLERESTEVYVKQALFASRRRIT